MKIQKEISIPYVCIIGCANIDVVGFPEGKLILRDANQGHLQISMGGVGRNIAENLVRLGISVKLITVIGDDAFSILIEDHCRHHHIDIRHSLFLKNRNAAIHMAIMNEDNDLALAVSAMNIYDQMDTSFISQKEDIINNACLTVVDTSMPKEVISMILSQMNAKQNFVEIDAGPKTDRIFEVLHHIDFLKLNKIEVELLCNLKLRNDEDVVRAADFLHGRGVSTVIVSLGKKGLYYSINKAKTGTRKNRVTSNAFVPARMVEVVNTNGAGDALTSGIIYGIVKECTFLQSIRYGQACAMMTVQHKDTVSEALTESKMINLVDTL